MHRFSSLCNRIWPNIQAKSIRPIFIVFSQMPFIVLLGGFDLSHCCAPLDIHFPHHNDIRFRYNRFEWAQTSGIDRKHPDSTRSNHFCRKNHCHYIIDALVFAQLDNFNGKTVVYLNILWSSTTEHDLIFHFFYAPREKSCLEPTQKKIDQVTQDLYVVYFCIE